MKHVAIVRITILIGFTSFLTACPVKNRPRQVHEQAKTWTPTETPVDESVSNAVFSTVNLDKVYQQLNSPDASNQSKSIMQTLAPIVLNGKFVENPKFRTTRMRQMINAFNRAFLAALDRRDNSAEMQKLKADYYETVNAGCSEDLRTGCNNIDLFREDAYFGRIMVRFAQEYDAQIETELAKFKTPDECLSKSETCSGLFYERYRRLAMATGKRNAYQDKEYAFSYLKYARTFAILIERDKKAGRRISYLSEVHGKIFEAIIMHYDPKNVSSDEFRAFVENFSPWTYSLKKADLFEHGTKKMFEFGAKCCLYTDAQKTQLSKSLIDAISQTQLREEDAMGESFYKKVKNIHDHNSKIFENLGLGGEVNRLLNLNSSFYNEYFLVVDRLFRGHLRPSEVEMILSNAQIARTRELLPKTIETYVKIYMVDMMMQTNDFMNVVYNKQIDSNRLFTVATTESNELTAKWHNVQTQSDQLERAMVGFFRGRNIFDQRVENTSRLIKAINRNVHYLSVYPNMIVMTYFLSKAHGNINVPLGWRTIQINAGTVLNAFFDGSVPEPWYHFGKDVEPLTREMLLYSFEYMLKTDALGTFQNDRAKFYDLIFSKYLADNIYSIRGEKLKLDRDVYGHNNMKTINAVCDYELNGGRDPGMRMTLFDLAHYTYTGMGDNGINETMVRFLKDPGDIVATMRAKVDTRINFVRAMIAIIEKDLERRGETVAAHKETATAYDVLRQLQNFRSQVMVDFVKAHQRNFTCALKLKEIERRRANRLYEEERAHLSQIFDRMKPLVKISDPDELKQKVKEINLSYFRNASNGYRFDEFEGTAYIMSKYDLLMRMKRLVEADIFAPKTRQEAQDPYNKARHVIIDEPEALVRDDIVAKKISSKIFVTGDTEADRKAFIEQAMSLMNGQGGSYIDWFGQLKGKSYDTYISMLLEMYFQGPVTDGEGMPYEVSARDVVKAFIRAQASYGMDDADRKNAMQFGSEGSLDSNYYKDRLFEGNGTALPFFYKLMLEAIGRSGTILDDSSEKATAGAEALRFATNEINLRDDALSPDYRPGSFVFKPGQDIAGALKNIYGSRANYSYQRAVSLFNELSKLEADMPDLAHPPMDKAQAWGLDLNELARLDLPIYIANGKPVSWYNGPRIYVDEQKRRDQLIMIDDFTRRTGNFYGTKEAVKR